jgi:hypothetical protein
MFVTNILIARTIILMALAGNGSCPGDVGHEDGKTIAQKTAMFPDGLVQDFGVVRRRIQARHAFRIVNTSAVPLRVVSLRFL